MEQSEREDTLASAEAALTEAAKAILLMIATMDQRETRMHETIGKELQSLRNEVTHVRGEVATIVRGASTQIAEEAKQAVSPVADRYNRDVTATSAQLHSANKTVQIWFAAGCAVLLLALVVGWMVLGYYRDQLTDTRQQLQNYKDATLVVQAFYASDATICNDRLCVNVDPNGQRFGDKHQYHLVKPRAQP
jgi:hypothetical protein